MIVLEYCKNGTLKQYLQTVRECFDTEIADRLARIAYGICLGMDYQRIYGEEPICRSLDFHRKRVNRSEQHERTK
jgi:hypothetical protein